MILVKHWAPTCERKTNTINSFQNEKHTINSFLQHRLTRRLEGTTIETERWCVLCFKTVMNTVEEWISATQRGSCRSCLVGRRSLPRLQRAQRSRPLRPSRGDDQWRGDDISEAPTLLSQSRGSTEVTLAQRKQVPHRAGTNSGEERSD